MRTDCSSDQLEFQGVAGRRVVAEFNGGRQTSDAGLLLLREVAERTGLLRRFAGCFRDLRRADRIEHRVEELLAQRVLAQVQGYEDLNDHDTLRDDPLLALAAGKADLTGATRARERDRGHALAGKSTLNRLELTPVDATAASRYQKIVYDGSAVAQVFIDHFVDAHSTPPPRIVLDLDATDDPLHGQQEGRFFHGYYRQYCYWPSTSSAASSCCGRSCAGATSTLRPAASRRCRRSWGGSGLVGPRWRSGSVPTRASPVNR